MQVEGSKRNQRVPSFLLPKGPIRERDRESMIGNSLVILEKTVLFGFEDWKVIKRASVVKF